MMWKVTFGVAILATIVNPISTTSQEFLLNGPNMMFTFTSQSFLELRPNWPLRERRELCFKFRTRLAHGLLVQHGILNPPTSLKSYDLNIKVENGRIRVTHIFNNDITTAFIGEGEFKGLNRDQLHSVCLKINPSTGEMEVNLNNLIETMSPKSLKTHPDYGYSGETVDSVLFFGGFNKNDTTWATQYGYEQFVGCIGNIELQTNNQIIDNLKTFSNAHVNEGCIDRCEFDDLCLHRSVCLNHYKSMSCDCFGTDHEGEFCSHYKLTTITLRGYSYVSYKIYEWVDKVHSDFTRISLSFRTSLDDSVLFYGLGETPIRNYIAASLRNGSVHVSVDFGDQPFELILGRNLNDDWWHNLTVVHDGNRVQVILDKVFDPSGIITIPGVHHFHLDPRFYVGGVPFKTPKFGLKSMNNYVGSFRECYFGPVSMLERLKNKDPATHYHGLFPPEYEYAKVTDLPVTFFYPESKIRLKPTSDAELHFSLDFKTNYTSAVLAHSAVSQDLSFGYWQLALENGAAIISVETSGWKNSTFNSVKLGGNLDNGKWHRLNVDIVNGKVVLTVNNDLSGVEYVVGRAMFSPRIYVGGSTLNPRAGFVGCMRQIMLNGHHMDPRVVIDSDQIEDGEISLDNCQLVDPCAQPGICEHGGKCHMEGKRVHCNCNGTGYTGETCHFSIYRRTCEELFLFGYREKGVYKIDIDGNGPHPPAYVYCDVVNELTTTTVFTNLPSEMVVRRSGMKDFRIEVTYRNFTAEMLQTLIRHSKNCTQFIKFDCFKVPLGLWSYTWFHTSYTSSKRRLSSLGSKYDGYCQCGDAGNCTNPSKMCNCDAVDQRWRFDAAELQDPRHLGITEMFFLQPENMSPEAQLRVTLGPLKCIETDTQRYVITFKTSESFLEIPGWKTGDLAFSFRTSNKKAILFYQPSQYQTHSHFKIFLVNENDLAFEFSVRSEPRSVIITSVTPLNTGKWQQVWVDYDRHHVRFTINLESKMINLEKNEEFGPFEGPLYVGGAPQEYMHDSRIEDGFVGCLRGLVINEEVTNLYSYLGPRTPQIVVNCKPSCDSNPCQNGAICHELWGAFECECANKIAHSGNLCESNINSDGVTFVTENGHFHKLYTENKDMPPILTEDILLNIRTYEMKGIILYAHNHFNNFIQLHIEDGKKLILTLNSHRSLIQGIVTYEDLNRGKSVQLKIERQPEQINLYVNDDMITIPHGKGPMSVDQYRQNPWVSGQELELVKPPRPPVEPKPYLQIYLGALDPNSMEFKLPGFIGCVTGLRIGTKQFDLVSLVEENPGTENFRKGCNMSCDTVPCKNNGYCREDWKNQLHTCHCSLTSYLGKTCEEDIGGTFDGTTLVKHQFTPDASTYQRVKVQLAFSTISSFKLPAVILFVNSKVDEKNYIMVALSPSGELIVQEEDGSKRVITSIVKPKNNKTFTDGVRHWISYTRNVEKNVELLVDNHQYPISFSKEKDSTEPPKYGGESNDVVMVGGMEVIDNRFVNYINYSGCLSNVVFTIDSFISYPLESAFGKRPGGPNLITIGHLMKVRCATFETPQNQNNAPSFEDLSMFVGPTWVPSTPVEHSYVRPKQFDRDREFQIAEATTKRVGLVMGIFLLVLVISVAIYVWRLDWKDKQYRYEEEFDEENYLSNKKRQYLDSSYKGYQHTWGYNGNYYHELYEMTVLKPRSPDSFRGCNDAKQVMHNEIEDPNSEAETKLVYDSEDDPEANSEDSIMKKSESLQELEWEPTLDRDELQSEEFAESKSEEKDEVRDNHENNLIITTTPKTPEASVVRRPKKFVGGPQPSPVFLPNSQRSFANPISYLGGPTFQQPDSKRNSTESILSLD